MTTIPSFALHDLCKIMPSHTEKEFLELLEDIRKNKLQLPITIYEGKILDGRGRYNACVDEFVSSQGVWRFLKARPLCCCFVDELGEQVALINDQKGNPQVETKPQLPRVPDRRFRRI